MAMMKKGMIISIVMVLLFGVVGCSGSQPAPKPANPAATNEVTVKVAPVSKGDIASYLSYSGDVRARNQVSVLPKSAGRIDDLRVDVGSQVKQGDVIAVVEHASLDAQLQQANANLESAKAKYDQVANPSQATLDTAMAGLKKAEAALKLAQTNYDQVSWRGDIASLPQATALEQATLDYQIALANYNMKSKPSDQDIAIAKAAVSQAEAAVTIASNALKDATIVAPISGVITDKLLSKGAMAGPTTPIVNIVSQDVEIAVSVEEAHLAELKSGQMSSIKVAAYPDQTFTGKVDSIAPASDAKSRTFTVKVVPDPQDGKLRPGMYAEVDLQTQKHTGALLVPKDAVVLKNGQSLVFTVVDGKAKSNIVQTGLSDSSNIEILAGLSPTDQVIVGGLTNLNDGDSVVTSR